MCSLYVEEAFVVYTLDRLYTDPVHSLHRHNTVYSGNAGGVLR